MVTKRSAVAAARIAAAGVLLCPLAGLPQTAQTPMAFDAASMRRNTNNVGVCNPDQVDPTPSGFRMTNCPLIVVLGTAYIPSTGDPLGFVIGMGDRIVGMPDWMTSERYNITARISDGDAEAWKDPARRKTMLRAMLQTLLKERCKLTVHRDMKDRPVFAIVTGKDGPKLRVANTTAADTLHAKYPNATSVPVGGGIIAAGENGARVLYGATIGTLALVLTYPAGRPVIDKTGLTGRYDIEVPRMQNMSPELGTEDGTPSISDVLDRLGLKLETQKSPLEMLVIDHVERPTEN